jgi:hypothetical protein
MDKVQNPSNSVCYTPSSEPYRIYMKQHDLFILRTSVLSSTFISDSRSYISTTSQDQWEYPFAENTFSLRLFDKTICERRETDILTFLIIFSTYFK